MERLSMKLKYIGILGFVLLFASCTHSDFREPKVPDYTTISIDIIVPGQRADHMRAQAQDNIIQDITLFLFGENGALIKKIDVSGSDNIHFKSNIPEGGAVYQVKIPFEANPSVRKVHFIANASTIANLASVNSESDIKTLKKSVSNGSISAPFPMWGLFLTPSGIVADMAVNQVRLLRCVSKLTVDITESARKYLFIESIGLYNIASSGLVAPKNINVPLEIGSPVTEQNIPSDASISSLSSPLPYVSKEGSPLYFFETYNGNTISDNSQRPCLIIKAKYPYSIPTAKSYYYRIDLISPVTNAYISNLRNYHYAFNILSVLGKGFDTLEEALKSKAANIFNPLEVQVTVSEEYNSVSTNGTYRLLLTQADTAYLDVNNKLVVTGTTNYPIKSINDIDIKPIQDVGFPGWLTKVELFSAISYVSGENKFAVYASFGDIASLKTLPRGSRTFYAAVRVGGLEQIIPFTQSLNEFIFYGSQKQQASDGSFYYYTRNEVFMNHTVDAILKWKSLKDRPSSIKVKFEAPSYSQFIALNKEKIFNVDPSEDFLKIPIHFPVNPSEENQYKEITVTVSSDGFITGKLIIHHVMGTQL